MASKISLSAVRRLRPIARKPKLPHWHGSCSLDHKSAAEAARCNRTD